MTLSARTMQPAAALEQAMEREARTTAVTLVNEAGQAEPEARSAVEPLQQAAWSVLLGESDIDDAGSALRLAGLRVAAEALRRGGVPRGGRRDPTPLPEGLTAEALRGACQEVIPGQRSVAGLHLRGWTLEELALLYGLSSDRMQDRSKQALENLRSALHRRAQRMNQEGWSRGLESQPIEELRGALRERPADGGSRLDCPATDDLARAVHGTHFRGGREAVLDHGSFCDPCAAELRVLLALRRQPLTAAPVALDDRAREELHRVASSRTELRSALPDPALRRRNRRRLWPWALLLLAAVLAIVLIV
jgi:hypothetical protein